MVAQVAKTIARYGMFLPGQRVGVAISGGPDSVALLHCLRALAGQLQITLGVVHLNHQLRGAESDEDQAFVAELARRLDLRFFTQSVDVRGAAANAGDNLEQVGRKLRYQWFTELMRQPQFERIATGHTRSDQAETVLFRLLRGAAGAGLSGIRPVREPGIVRPLIEVEREQVLAYLRAAGHEWREDPSNQRNEFSRNRIRRQLLPQLTRDWNPQLPSVLAHLAEWAQGEEDYWRGAMSDLVPRHLDVRGNAVELQTGALAPLPAAVQRRLLRAAIEAVRGDLLGVGYEHVEATRRLLLDSRGEGQVHLPGVHVTRSFQSVRLAAAENDAPGGDFSLMLEAPGEFSIPGSSCVVVLNLLDLGSDHQRKPRRDDNKEGYNGKRSGALDWERVPKPLILRNWRPGDRYRPRGEKGSTRLKVLFQDHKVAAWERPRWPVIAARAVALGDASSGRDSQDEVIVWARGFGPAVEYAAGDRCRVALEITEVVAG